MRVRCTPVSARNEDALASLNDGGMVSRSSNSSPLAIAAIASTPSHQGTHPTEADAPGAAKPPADTARAKFFRTRRAAGDAPPRGSGAGLPCPGRPAGGAEGARGRRPRGGGGETRRARRSESDLLEVE